MQKAKEMEHCERAAVEEQEPPPFLEGIYRGHLDSNVFLLKTIWVHLHSGSKVVETLNYNLYLNFGMQFSPVDEAWGAYTP